MLKKIVIRFIFILVTGTLLSLWVIQNNSTVKHTFGTKLISFLEDEWDSKITVDSVKINFFTCSIFLKNGTVTSAVGKDYMWKFDQCKVYISPIALLLKKKIALSLSFNNLAGKTSYQSGRSDLTDHIQDIFTPKTPNLKVSVKSFSVHNAGLSLHVPTQNNMIIDCHLPASFSLTKQSPCPQNNQCNWKGYGSLVNAHVTVNKKILLHSLSGTISLEKSKKLNAWGILTNLNHKSSTHDQAEMFSSQLTWTDNKKSFLVSHQNKIPLIHATMTDQETVRMTGNIPLSLVSSGLQFVGNGSLQTTPITPPIDGTGILDITMHLKENCLITSGTIELEKLCAGGISLDKIILKFAPEQKSIKSSVGITQDSLGHILGSFNWNLEHGSGSLTLTNTMPLTPSKKGVTVNNFCIQPEDLVFTLTYSPEKSLSGTYICTLTNKTTEKQICHRGALVLKNNQIGIKGNTDHGSYSIKAQYTPHPHLTSVQYATNKRSLVQLTTAPHKPMTLEGTVHWAFLRSFLDHDMRRYIFNNNCVFSVAIDQSNQQQIHGTVNLCRGRFFVPDHYNLIQSIHADILFDVLAKKLMCNDLTIKMSKGDISCPRATISLNDDYSVSMLHVPATINNVFINKKQDFYGIVYGNILINKLPNNPLSLSGSLVLKKSLLKDTFSSNNNNSALYGPMGNAQTLWNIPVALDVKVSTEKPIRAKTPAIDTHANLDLVIKNVVTADLYNTPQVTGNINLAGGFLKFLNNKLYIEFGKVQFIASSMNDPLVDLIAKNRIGKYLVNLQVTGSLQKPTIILESTPDLTEEQIVGLLLNGSEVTSLQDGLPSIIMQHLDTFLFDSKRKTKPIPWIDKLSKTFKYVKITPNFGDDAHATKLTGSISVNVTDQLRAQVQKNLDLEKEFSAQLEYMISDDINLKVVKDQRGELGSEVEMRLKLG